MHHRGFLLLLAGLMAAFGASAQSSQLRPLPADAASMLGVPVAGVQSQVGSGSTPQRVAVQSAPAPAGPAALAPMQPSALQQFGAPVQPARAQAPASYAAPPAQQQSVLPAGSRLSQALEAYVRERGWQLRWLIDEDYVLDAVLPIPAGSDPIHGVTWVVNTYQSQGGMLGVVPRFARGNQVVVIEKMDVRDVY